MLIALVVALAVITFLGQFFVLGDGRIKNGALNLLTVLWLFLILAAVYRAGWKGGLFVVGATLVFGLIMRPFAAYALVALVRVSRE